MAQILNYIYIACAVVILFGAAIFVHEFGHFWVARWRGLKVLEFSIGFGPKIFGWRRKDIDYSVRWIPFGGYVKLPQLVTSAVEGKTPEGEQYPPVSPFSKILVSVAGPLMNIVFAFVIATFLHFVGVPVLINPSIIGNVDPHSEEAKMGIQSGDRIVAVDGKPVRSWQDVFNITMLATTTNRLPVAIERNGVTNTYKLQTVVKEMANSIKVKMLNLESNDRLLVKNVSSGSPAETAGLKSKDEIETFAGLPVTSYDQFVKLVQKREGQPTPIDIKRGGKVISLTVSPHFDPSTRRSRIGIEFDLRDHYQIEHPTPWEQVSYDLNQIWDTVRALIHTRQSGVTVSELSGPVGIIQFLAIQVKTDWRLALRFFVFLSINLGILNLLPLPVLDGGHIVMSLIEGIRRKPLSPKLVEYTFTVFAILLISFILYVTFADIKRISIFRSVFQHETHIEQPAKPATNPAK